MKTKILSLVIAAALSVGSAQAADPPTKAPTAQQQAARAEIDKLVQRIQELSKQLGEDTDVRVMIRRAHDMHRMHRMDGMDSMHAMHGDGAMRGRPGLGIVMMPNAAASGVRIVAVTPDSPAMKAGLRSDDVLLSIDGKKIAGNGMAAVETARGLLGDLRQGQNVKLGYAREGKTGEANVKVDVIGRMMMFQRSENGAMPAMPGMHEHMQRHIAMMSPEVEREIERIGPMKDCSPDSEDCHLPAMFEAFRWQGLNLASVDASLGRYFGTDKGVLVLSSGPELKGLQSGDVIARVAGNEVKSPRDVMRALREKPVGSQIRIDLLRDRKTSAVTITVPKARALPFLPPAPPAPPAPPTPPTPPAAAPPPAPPAPPAPPRDGAAAFAPEAMPGDTLLPIAQVQDIDRDGIEQIEITGVLIR